ncbi:polypyrimidine tract-binding protein homolog 3-like isoform X2 [Papaver somniferum]|uniref:polypyrimidine tract-binding protein homolog 3-like isoform X2 n=1 Tax=Papaver somniferum TaxID=3469 RepID=UPI000E7000BB|nr:polypyrimidine tract-binding protein homolog 3-like isoform X2 [Papaver somniferum]
MAAPSEVVHVRNVGPEISENDLRELVQPFGNVTKLVILRATNQMVDVAAAVNLIQHFMDVQPSVRGRNIFFRFASLQEMRTMDRNGQGRKGWKQACFSLLRCDPETYVPELPPTSPDREDSDQCSRFRKVVITMGASILIVAGVIVLIYCSNYF